MSEKVFIGWSGSNTIAEAVKIKLKTKGFEGVVGGDTRKETSLFLGQSILNEIDQCHQAIFIMQLKKDGFISANTLFEFGYCLSRLDRNKIHVYYIDIPEKKVPSDLEGIWAKKLNDASQEEIENTILNVFLDNQKNIIGEENFNTILSYYNKRNALSTYSKKPFCSEYEFAKYLLFYAQAAYMHHDITEGSEHLKDFVSSQSLDNEDELFQSSLFAQAYFNIFLKKETDRENGTIYLKEKDFCQIKDALDSVKGGASQWNKNELKIWTEILSLDALNYIYILRAAAPDAKDIQNDLYEESIKHALDCLNKCKELEAISNENGKSKTDHMICLYKAYMHRNLATAYTNKDNPDIEEANRQLCLSLKERKSLRNYCLLFAKDTVIYDNLEMEYFLVLSELLNNDPEYESSAYSIHSCDAYLTSVKEKSSDRDHYIDKIEQNISNVKKRKSKKQNEGISQA